MGIFIAIAALTALVAAGRKRNTPSDPPAGESAAASDNQLFASVQPGQYAGNVAVSEPMEQLPYTQMPYDESPYDSAMRRVTLSHRWGELAPEQQDAIRGELAAMQTAWRNIMAIWAV